MHKTDKYKIYYLFIFTLLISSTLHAQETLKQLSGIVADKKTRLPLQNATVTIGGSYRGTYSDALGFFSLVVSEYDTIQFSYLGYEVKKYIVPDTFQNVIISIGVFLQRDTILLHTVEIYPWPSRQEFKEAFLTLPVTQYAVRNLSVMGITNDIDTIPPAPTIMNPVSLFYEQVVKPIEWNRKKKNKTKELPVWK